MSALLAFFLTASVWASVSASINQDSAQITVTDQKDGKDDALDLFNALTLPAQAKHFIMLEKQYVHPAGAFVVTCGQSKFSSNTETCAFMIKKGPDAKITQTPFLITFDSTQDPNPFSALFIQPGDTHFEYQSHNGLLQIEATPTTFHLQYN